MLTSRVTRTTYACLVTCVWRSARARGFERIRHGVPHKLAYSRSRGGSCAAQAAFIDTSGAGAPSDGGKTITIATPSERFSATIVASILSR